MGNRKESHVTKQKFDEFVLAHGRDILWFCRMTAGNAHEGDELYQDTMLTLLEHLDRLDEKNNSLFRKVFLLYSSDLKLYIIHIYIIFIHF